MLKWVFIWCALDSAAS